MERYGWHTLGKFFTLALILLVGVQLLMGSEAAAGGVRQSLVVCGNVLIPSLFPFMVLAAFLPATAAGRLAAAPFGLLGRLLYGLPLPQARALAPALLMSWVGGYPAGARTLAALVQQRRLTPENAGRALCFCVNSGPAFLVTVVGAGIFGSVRVGLILFACQLAAGALTGRLLTRPGRLGLGALPSQAEKAPEEESTTAALVASVSSAAAGMLSICAFVLLCGALGALLAAGGATARLAELLVTWSGGVLTAPAAAALVGGSIEICTGCAAAGQLPPLQALLVLPFLLSFSGLSVLCQVAAVAGEQGIPMGRFLLSRPLHGLLTGALAYLLLHKEFPAALPVGLITSPALRQDPKSVVGALLLLALCALLFLSLEPA